MSALTVCIKSKGKEVPQSLLRVRVELKIQEIVTNHRGMAVAQEQWLSPTEKD